MSVNEDNINKIPDTPTVTNTDVESDDPLVEALENTNKSRWERSWPTITCGAGLFSDGYLNGVRDFFIYYLALVPRLGSFRVERLSFASQSLFRMSLMKNALRRQEELANLELKLAKLTLNALHDNR